MSMASSSPFRRRTSRPIAELSTKCGKVWREHGALDYREWVADDVKVGKLTSFPRSVKLKPGETVVFSWITYKSRAQRDKVNAKVMADPRLKSMMDPKSLPFDAKRMIYGGFESLVKVVAPLSRDCPHITILLRHLIRIGFKAADNWPRLLDGHPTTK